jgi:hypothetical protein
MAYSETGKEKAKREAYMKANKERGIRQEAERDYKMFGTTEQNIPNVNPMGDVVTPAAMKKGGKIMEHKHNVDHVKHHYESAGHKHEQDKVAMHKESHKMHHDHVKAMCGGGMTKKHK